MWEASGLPPGIQRKLDDLAIEQHQVQNWHSEFWEIRNAKNMGIQEALDSLPSTGGLVYVPSGTYTITKSIYMKSNQALVGAGQSSIITTKTANIDLIKCTNVGQANVTPGVYIANLHLIGCDSGAGNGIKVKNSHYTTIRDCWIEKVAYGIYFYALDADSDNTDNNIITNNYIFNTLSVGIFLYGETAGRCEDNVIQGNVLNYCEAEGIRINPGRRNSVVGNTVEDCSDHGIILHSGSKNVVMGNVVTEGVKHGIYLNSEDHSIISGNSCCYNDCNDTATYDGISIVSDSNYNTIIGNTCTENDRYGIHIDDADCDKNIVLGNIAITNTTGQIQDDGTNTDVGHNQTT